jgi:hypothetical protein
MLLLPDQVGLGEPPLHLRVDLGRLVQPEDVHLVARRDDVDAAEARTFHAAGQNDVAVNPAPAEAEGGEAHADLECDSSLLRQDRHRT